MGISNHTHRSPLPRHTPTPNSPPPWPVVEIKATSLLVFFTLPTTSMIIAKSFACVQFEDGEGGADTYMLVDMTIRCDNARYQTVYSFAVAMGLVFPVSMCE